MARVCDYFVVVGAAADTALEPLPLPSQKQRQRRSSSKNKDKEEEENDDAFGAAFRAEVVSRVPATDRADAPLPPHVPLFCFPQGLRIARRRRRPRFFAFVLTAADGARFFGAALHIDEARATHPPLPPALADAATSAPVHFPACLCVLSRVPLFSAFREFLRALYRCCGSDGKSGKAGAASFCSQWPAERIVANFLFDVPLPAPGMTRVVYRPPFPLPVVSSSSSSSEGGDGKAEEASLNQTVATIKLPASTHFPLADFSFRYLFDCLGVDAAVALFLCALAEHKILFVSRQYTLLTVAAETLTTLMLPFRWHHVYIPILNTTLADFLQAPTPFIMGVIRDGDGDGDGEDPVPKTLSDDVLVVDLDTGRLRSSGNGSGGNTSSAFFGSAASGQAMPEREALARRLGNILTPHLVNLDAAFPPGDPCAFGDEEEEDDDERQGEKRSDADAALARAAETASLDTRIRVAFLHFFVALFGQYRSCLRFLRKYPAPITFFDKARFLGRCHAQSHPSTRAFLQAFLETQAFTMFSEAAALQRPNVFDLAAFQARSRGDPGLECILFRRNRNPRTRELVVPPPSLAGIPRGAVFTYERFPQQLDHSLLLSSLHPPHSSSSSSSSPSSQQQQQCDTLDEKEVLPEIECFPPGEVLVEPAEAEGGDVATPAEAQLAAECVARLMASSKLTTTQKELLLELLALPHGGITVARAVAEYTSTHTDTRVEAFAFERISALLYRLIARSKDHMLPWTLLRPISAIFQDVGGLPEFVHSRVSDLDVWKDGTFWEFGLIRGVQEQRQGLAGHFRSTTDDWAAMDAAARKAAADADEKIVFDATSRLVFSMAMVGASDADTRRLITRAVTLCRMTEQQLAALTSLAASIAKSNKASAAHLEAVKAQMRVQQQQQQQQQQPDSAREGQSPSKRGSIRELRMHLARRLMPQQQTPRDADAAALERGRPMSARLAASSPPSPAAAAAALLGGASVTAARRDEYSVAVLDGHAGAVECVAVVGGGGCVVAAGTSAGKVLLWNVETREHVGPASAHTDKVTAVKAVDRVLLSGSHDHSVNMHDVETLAGLGELKGHTGQVLAVDANADTVVSCGRDGSVRVWDTRAGGGQAVGVLNGHDAAVGCLQMGRRGAGDSSPVVATGSEDETARVWDLRMFSCVHTLRGHADWIRQVAFDTRTVVTASCDCTLRLWDLASGECRGVLTGHTGSVDAFAFASSSSSGSGSGSGSASGELISGSADATLIRWDLSRCVPAAVYKGHSDAVSAVSVLDDARIVSASFDHTIRVWKRAGRSCLHTLHGHSDWISALICTQSGAIVSSSWDSTLRAWNLAPPSSSAASAASAAVGTSLPVEIPHARQQQQHRHKHSGSPPTSASSSLAAAAADIREPMTPQPPSSHRQRLHHHHHSSGKRPATLSFDLGLDS